jgi:hypothetical protein
MSLEETKVIDSIGVDKATNDVVLTIVDHLSWSNEEHGDHNHLLLLQEKLNTYLSFIEGGELLEKYPDSRGRKILIDVVGKHRLGIQGESFFTRASTIVTNAGFSLRFRLFNGEQLG